MSDAVPLNPVQRAARVKAHAEALGFDRVGIAPPEAPGAAWTRYKGAMDSGFGGAMEWLTKNPDVRRDVRAIEADARAVIALSISYPSEGPGVLEKPLAPDEGWIARYALGRDYHLVIRKMLIAFARRLSEDPDLGFPAKAHRVFVDTGPVLEKAYAARAGLGWIGKNTLLINRELGSWTFLAVVITPLDLAFDTPATDHCGSCRACLDVCPTDAFPEPHVLDARRCIAYWTIEAPEPEALIEPDALGPHIFGCDLCQEVCPWNRKAAGPGLEALAPRPENIRPKLASLRDLDEAEFRSRFSRSAVRRVDAERMGTVIKAVQKGRSTGPDQQGS